MSHYNQALGYEYLFKILVIGDSGVGKSCLLMRFADCCYKDEYISTIGVDFKVRTINLSNDKVAKLQIWDTAGQERFRSITSSYYRGAHGIVIMYDISDRVSFNNVNKWLNEVKRHAQSNVICSLIGNKSDLKTRREVGMDEGQKFADDNGMFFIETSSKSNHNVEDVFYRMACEIHSQINGQNKTETSTSTSLKQEMKGGKSLIKSSSCC